MKARAIARVVPGVETSDGAGVRLRRSLGSQRGLHHDPFVMNTHKEIEQAVADYRNGTLAGPT